MGKCLEVFNETGCKLEFYGYFEDGWNAALKHGDSTAHNNGMPKCSMCGGELHGDCLCEACADKKLLS